MYVIYSQRNTIVMKNTIVKGSHLYRFFHKKSPSQPLTNFAFICKTRIFKKSFNRQFGIIWAGSIEETCQLKKSLYSFNVSTCGKPQFAHKTSDIIGLSQLSFKGCSGYANLFKGSSVSISLSETHIPVSVGQDCLISIQVL